MATTKAESCAPIGYLEIAELLDVAPVTVRQWKWKKQMPEPDYGTVHGMPAWERSTIIVWAGQTGKLKDDELITAYKAITGHDPIKYRKGGRMPAPTE